MNTETQQRLELLKLARQELNNRYIKDRADAYTQWNVDSDQAWRESGIKLPFPPPPPMPSETDVIAYALAIHNAQNPPVAPAPEPVASPPVHTVVESVPVTVSAPMQEEPAPVAVEEPIKPVEPIAPTPLVAADTPVVTMPEVLPPPTLVVPQLVAIAGAADLATGETAIKEIFNKPSGAPDMVASETPAPSVVPLIKSMLKRGLLPSWVKADDAGVKE